MLEMAVGKCYTGSREHLFAPFYPFSKFLLVLLI
jgi:hypothetical protein